MFKRVLSLIICVLTLVSGFVSTGIFVSANTDVTDEIMEQAKCKNRSIVSNKTTGIYVGTCGDNLTWNFDNNGTLNIYGYGKMQNFSEPAEVPWYSLKSSIENIIINDGIMSIGDYAFTNSYYLTTVIVSNSVVEIGRQAFSGCEKLSDIELHDSVSSIGYRAFYECTSLYNITLNNPEISIGAHAFYKTGYYNTKSNWRNGLLYINKNLIVANQTTSGRCVVENGTLNIASSAFDRCKYITSIDIPNSVKTIGSSAFYECVKLETVTIPNTVIIDLNNAFYGCESLIGVTLPDTVSIIGMSAFYNCKSLRNITLPNKTSKISSSAFSNCSSIKSIGIPNTVKEIGMYAFSGCSNLTNINIFYAVSYIGSDAFYNCNKLKIRCYEDSYGYEYATRKGISVEILTCEHQFSQYVLYKEATCLQNEIKISFCDLGCGKSEKRTIDNTTIDHIFTNYEHIIATCTSDAYSIAYCDHGCGTIDTIINEGSALGHTWTEWMVTIEPSYTTEGEQIRYCTVCKLTEGKKIPVLEPPYDPGKPVITVDNFTVTITNADYIKDMRYARGEYTTTTEIRNAEGNVALDNGVVTANTVDGDFIYEMPNGGYYTIWIRMKDGTNYILPLPLTNINASVSTYGVKITLHDLFDVKDFYIAKGEYQTYREIKDNGYIVSVTSAKIGNKHDYTYTVYEPGIHTILVRYNDGRTVVFHEDLTVTEPTFTTNGLQVTIGNIPDVKVIRTAYGEYYTPGDTKRAPGARNFSNKSVIKNADEYTIQYRDEGIVTIIVEYNNGYVKVFHYDVVMKRADCMQAMSSVIFDNIDGFVLIRYAMGEYTTSAEIKRASGSKVIKPIDITDNRAIISGLAKGTYTFCVQYDDESYNYFVITVEG